MDSSREKVIQELADLDIQGSYMSLGEIADFIISDRKRICEPLVKYKHVGHNAIVSIVGQIYSDVKETLRNAGLDE